MPTQGSSAFASRQNRPLRADGYLLLGRLDFAGPPMVDSDADGLPDFWETTNQLDPSVNDAGADPDMDGATNLGEYLAGTNPSSPNSVPRIDLFTLPDAQLRLVFSCASGRRYQIEQCRNLTQGEWTTLDERLSLGGFQTFDVSVSGADAGFFRLRIETE